MNVFIILEGEDCEGAYVQAVFGSEDDAVKYLDKKYPGWEKTTPTDRRSGCTSAFIEEWEVNE